MSNNVLIPEPSLNLWKTYFLSFIDHKENEYTRIFHLETLTVVIHTCERNCYSCWDGFNTCTDCTNSDYAYAEDSPDGCFLKTYPVEGLIYNSSHNMFLLCYSSCKFCTDASSDATDQKCSSCSSGYLYSYTNLGNCYRYTGLEITADKEVDLNQELFISSTCSNYKIASTGECVDACTLTTPYYTYEYGQTPPDYEQVFFNPPKYLYNNLCLESCPDNSTPDENYVCKCNNCFYKDSNEILLEPRIKNKGIPTCYYCGELSGRREYIIYKLFQKKCEKLGDLIQLSISGIDYINNMLQNPFFNLPKETEALLSF